MLAQNAFGSLVSAEAAAAIAVAAYGSAVLATTLSPTAANKATGATRILAVAACRGEDSSDDDDDEWPVPMQFVAVVPLRVGGARGVAALALGAAASTTALGLVAAALLAALALRSALHDDTAVATATPPPPTLPSPALPPSQRRRHAAAGTGTVQTLLAVVLTLVATYYGPSVTEAAVYVLFIAPVAAGPGARALAAALLTVEVTALLLAPLWCVAARFDPRLAPRASRAAATALMTAAMVAACMPRPSTPP